MSGEKGRAAMVTVSHVCFSALSLKQNEVMVLRLEAGV